MDIILLMGRIIFGGYFFLMGLNHLRNLTMMAGYAAYKGVPYPKFAVIGSGILILLGGLGVITGLYSDISLVLILIFLLGVTAKMHQFWKEPAVEERAHQMINFQKNLALIGATLILYATESIWTITLNF